MPVAPCGGGPPGAEASEPGDLDDAWLVGISAVQSKPGDEITEQDIQPIQFPISIKFRGRPIHGWYCIDDGGGGVSVHHANADGVLRRTWAATYCNDWDSMARIVLRELAELDASNSSLFVVDTETGDTDSTTSEALSR